MMKLSWRVARPYPTVQSGGMSAVAIATPGMTLLAFFLVLPMPPAMPPKSAMSTSQSVGLVLAIISLVAAVSGVSVK